LTWRIVVTLEERRSWTYLIVATVAYGCYLVVIVSRATSSSLIDVDYVAALLWSVAIAIGVNIALNITLGIATPRREHAKDARDREIALLGEHVGQAFLVIGGVAALLLALTEADHFFIANAVYLCFVLSAVVGSIARVVAYRRGI
jgi:drug/metabolite transporter (DMT)-like permease